MEDSRIVDLYWRRSGDAVTETSAKYGNYCYARRASKNSAHSPEHRGPGCQPGPRCDRYHRYSQFGF